MSSNNNSKNNSNKNDFVIRDGFPALLKQDGDPWLDYVHEPIPSVPYAVYNCHNLPVDTCRSDARQCCADELLDPTNESYSSGETYFWPCNLQPRTTLEAIVRDIFVFHTQHLPIHSFRPEQSGAEWWTLVLEENDNTNHANGTATAAAATTSTSTTTTTTEGKGKTGEKGKEQPSDVAADETKPPSTKKRPLSPPQPTPDDDDDDDAMIGMHYDADYGLEDQVPGLFLHPRLATITYLSDCGIPTLVLDHHRHKRQNNTDTAASACIDKGWLSHPRVGRHVAFDGRLLHGGPAHIFPAAKVQSTTTTTKRSKTEAATTTKYTKRRYTLLVNIWLNHCPLDAEPVDEEIMSKLTPLSADHYDNRVEFVKEPNDPVLVTAGGGSHIVREEFVVAQRHSVLEFRLLPVPATAVAQLNFPDGSLRLLTGEAVSSSDEAESQDGEKEEEKEASIPNV